MTADITDDDLELLDEYSDDLDDFDAPSTDLDEEDFDSDEGDEDTDEGDFDPDEDDEGSDLPGTDSDEDFDEDSDSDLPGTDSDEDSDLPGTDSDEDFDEDSDSDAPDFDPDEDDEDTDEDSDEDSDAPGTDSGLSNSSSVSSASEFGASSPPSGSSGILADIDNQISVNKDKFSVTDRIIELSSLGIIEPLKQSRKDTYAGLLTSIKEMGVLSPITVSVTEAFQTWTDSGKPAEEFEGIRYKVLDGFRRVYAATRLRMETIPARVISFKDPVAGSDMAVIFSQIVNRTQRRTWREVWSLLQVLEYTAPLTSTTLEWLLGLEPGEALKLKDVLTSDYPEIKDDLLSDKKTLQQAYSALQRARKEEGRQTDRDDERGISEVEGSENVVNQEETVPTLSPEEVKELLEMGSAEAEDLEETNFGDPDDSGSSGSADMFGEDAGDHVQDTKNRERLSPELRSAILRRDDFTCKCCGVGRGITSSIQLGLLECHHITSVYTGGSDSSDNFVTVCTRCHSFIHILAGFNCKIGMSAEEFEKVPEEDQKYIQNCVKYAKIILEAEKKSGKQLKKYKPERIPFWEAQADTAKIVDALAQGTP